MDDPRKAALMQALEGIGLKFPRRISADAQRPVPISDIGDENIVVAGDASVPFASPRTMIDAHLGSQTTPPWGMRAAPMGSTLSTKIQPNTPISVIQAWEEIKNKYPFAAKSINRVAPIGPAYRGYARGLMYPTEDGAVIEIDPDLSADQMRRTITHELVHGVGSMNYDSARDASLAMTLANEAPYLERPSEQAAFVTSGDATNKEDALRKALAAPIRPRPIYGKK